MPIGIYALIFKNTDKVYIGRSLDIDARYDNHISSLRRGVSSKKLQDGYDKYGTPELVILSICKENELNRKERELIAEFDSLHNGFNSSPGGEAGNIAPGEQNGRALGANTQYIEALRLLVETSMSTEQIANVTNLTISSVSNLCNGENHVWLKTVQPELYEKLVLSRLQNRNVKIAAAKRVYNTIFSPEGVLYDLANKSIKEFATENNLTVSKLSEVLNGRSKQHKGWHCGVYTDEYLNIPKVLISPEGKEFEVLKGSASKFAKANNMDPGALNKVLTKKALSHHGWILKN